MLCKSQPISSHSASLSGWMSRTMGFRLLDDEEVQIAQVARMSAGIR